MKKILLILMSTISINGYSASEHSMHGMYGAYLMEREASGTSWQPDTTPQTGIMVMDADTMSMWQGFVNGIYDHQGGPRGEIRTFATSMLMFMSQKDLPFGTVGFRSMLSLDPSMGKQGYPLLLQTGETADGKTHLIDWQHPHDFFMELAVTYRKPITQDVSAFLYLGLPGEPALGPPIYMMRWSDMMNPEAPISHHYFDSTHITYGVITAGLNNKRYQLETSVFNGREPDQNRWNIETPHLNSISARATYNPNPNWSMQLSYGYLKSPEALSPYVNTHRMTTSVTYNFNCNEGNNLQWLIAWGQNRNSPGHTLNAYLLEATLNHMTHQYFFGRFEHVQKDELFEEEDPLADTVFAVSKLTLGYLYEWSSWQHMKPALGALMSTYLIPNALKSTYGHQPFSYMVFGRISLA